ncbi:hypothetical protein F9B74_05590 [Pelistega sp. NLN82]|uniref:SMI1/KNR4 family protein n=1 Tax=Pelistega ratti TaxID=2652177 RepID=A0A6L9Y7J0_9BURK|nr:YrhA family protein [Pelistega ratti]NEN75797.1 hypothetical protein [Pelistega ratti]
MWKNQLEAIKGEKKGYGEHLNKGLTEEEIFIYLENKKKLLIPKEYINFIKMMNGFEFDGCILYGFQKNHPEDNMEKQIFDLFEYNEIWHKTLSEKTYTFLGETNVCWYVYNKETNKYNILDMPSAYMISECTTLDEMLDVFFNEISI